MTEGTTPMRRRFEQLRARPYAEEVLAANHTYLKVALPTAPVGAGERWVLTCLPATRTVPGRRRLSVVSMRNMETFVLVVDDLDPTTVHGFVIVRQSVALTGFHTLAALKHDLKLADVYPSTYQAAGFDQLALVGTAEDLIRALDNPDIAEAARELAADLTTSRTVYARFHNYHLAEAVLSPHRTERRPPARRPGA